MATQNASLHIVSSYEGSGTVKVSASDRPIVVFLASYETSIWTLDVEADARISKVYVSSYGPASRVVGLSEDVEVVHVPYVGSPSKWRDQNESSVYMPSEFKDFLSKVRCATDLNESDFQAHYGLGGQYVLPAASTPGIDRGQEVPNAVSIQPLVSLAADDLRSGYADDLALVPARHKENVEQFLGLIDMGKLPPFKVPSTPGADPYAPAAGVPWALPTRSQELFRNPDECERSGPSSDGKALGIVGLRGGSTIQCSWGDNWYALGDAADVLADSWGDDVIVAGGGDDVIDAGWGTDVIVFNKGWGKDVVSKTCHGAALSGEDAARLGWKHPYVNFMVFGPGLMPQDFEWQTPTKLVHAPSGDSVEVADQCFSLVFTEPGEIGTNAATSG